MSDNPPRDDNELLFVQLLMSFQAAAYQQMGKIASPFTGKIERNLEMARHSIDMLAMIQAKTKGNLTEQEERYLSNILADLRLNYVDEANKPEPEKDSADKSDKEKKDESAKG